MKLKRSPRLFVSLADRFASESAAQLPAFAPSRPVDENRAAADGRLTVIAARAGKTSPISCSRRIDLLPHVGFLVFSLMLCQGQTRSETPVSRFCGSGSTSPHAWASDAAQATKIVESSFRKSFLRDLTAMSDFKQPASGKQPLPAEDASIDTTSWLETAIAAARAGADELMKRRSSRHVSEKGPRDLVTDADLASQTVIRARLAEAFPDHAFVGEEEGENDPPSAVAAGDADAVPCWIVDPLDGTVNYVHRLQSFAVSIGCFAQGAMRVGVVYDPVREEMYTATDGGGAFLNGQPIEASGCTDVEEALVACSFAARARRDSLEVERFLAALERCRSLRRLGSCALNLCYVGAGCLDGYWAASVKSWDAAAGTLIATEAGARLTMIDGSPFDVWDPCFAAFATESLHRQMVDLLSPNNDSLDR